MCFGSSDNSFETKKRQKIRQIVANPGDQFVDDFVLVLTKMQNDSAAQHLGSLVSESPVYLEAQKMKTIKSHAKIADGKTVRHHSASRRCGK